MYHSRYGNRLKLVGLLLVLAVVSGLAAENYVSVVTLTPIYAQGGMATSTPSRFVDNDDDDDNETCEFDIVTEQDLGRSRNNPMVFTGTTDSTVYAPKRKGKDGHYKADNIRGSEACQWRGTANKPWISPQQPKGDTPPQRSTAQQFSINQQAQELKAGTHHAIITFSIRSGFFRSAKDLYVALEITHPCRLEVVPPHYLEFAMQDEQESDTVDPQSVTIRNPDESATCKWQAHTEQGWLDISPESGELAGGAEKELAVSLNPAVGKLPAGDEAHDLSIRLTSNAEARVVEGHLDIAPLPCRLRLQETPDLSVTGPYGGPFTPEAIPLKLTNEGGAVCNWNSAVGTPAGAWASVVPFSGAIEPDTTESVQILVGQAAGRLEPGSHSETITFQAGDAVPKASIDIALNVDALPCQLMARAVNDLDFRRDPNGDYNQDTATINLSNAAHRETCRWSASAGEWLDVSPQEGELPAGADATVTVAVNPERASSLAPQQEHQSSVKFASQGETQSETEIPASLQLECLKDQPCAVMHSSRTAIRYDESVETTLTLHNRSGAEITATLTLNPPNGWSLTAGDQGADCDSGCTRRFRIPAGEKDDISIQAQPNAPANEAKVGFFSGNASYFYSDQPQEKAAQSIVIPVTVRAASPQEIADFDDKAAAAPPAATTPNPTPTPAAVATAAPGATPTAPAATQSPDDNPDAGGTTTDAAPPFWSAWSAPSATDLAGSLIAVVVAAALVLALGLLAVGYYYYRRSRGASGDSGRRRRPRREGKRSWPKLRFPKWSKNAQT